MDANSFTLTEDRVRRAVRTTVARPLNNGYLASVAERQADASRFEQKPEPTTTLDSFRPEVSEPCFRAASAVQLVLGQMGECPDRVVRPRGGGIAFIFFGEDRYAALECDEDGVTVAMLSDRASDTEAEAWEVELGALTPAVRKIRSFLGAPNAASR